MKNPYEVLEINDGASMEEIKQAYREMVKKYHPDKYNDNPLRDLAEEKMREINEAYNYLVKNPQTDNNDKYRGSYEDSYSEKNYNSGFVFTRVREYINRNDILSAERELKGIGVRNAEWFYLSGIIAMRKGWYSEAYQDLQRAVNMDPSNYEYAETLNRLRNSNRAYMDNSYRRRGTSNDDLCNMCACLLCSDQCCECCGGDMISCC